MSKTKVLGRAGKHSSYLMRKHGFRALLAAVAALLILAAGTWATALSGNGFGIYAVIALVFAGMFAVVGTEEYKKSTRARIGTQAEKMVVKALKQARAACVINGVLIGAGGDLDHVVINHNVYALETKSGRRQVFADQAQTRLNPKTRDQVTRQARALSKVVGYTVHPVIVAPYLKNHKNVMIDGIPVCNAEGLRQVIRRPGPISSADAQELGARLWQVSKTGNSSAPLREAQKAFAATSRS